MNKASARDNPCGGELKMQAPLQDNVAIQNAKEGLHENGDLIMRSDAHHH